MILTYIEEKTEKLLKDLDIKKAPVEPSDIAKQLGVDVQPTSLEEEISGLFVMKDKMAFIRYNETEKNDKRTRFTIAHELGHFVLHKEISLVIDKGNNDKVLFRDSISSSGELHREREANAFAASLLMPKYLIETEIRKVPKNSELIAFLSNKFNVSEQAMNFRLINLGLIEHGLFS
jgi:Zn-dependent peptidase ImmA (M78 family)